MPESDGHKPSTNPQKPDVIAKLFGVSVRRVQQLTQEGIITTVRVGNANRYDLLPTIQRYINHLQDKAAGREAKKDDGSESRIAPRRLLPRGGQPCRIDHNEL